jgi:hypothetical protein
MQLDSKTSLRSRLFSAHARAAPLCDEKFALSGFALAIIHVSRYNIASGIQVAGETAKCTWSSCDSETRSCANLPSARHLPVGGDCDIYALIDGGDKIVRTPAARCADRAARIYSLRDGGQGEFAAYVLTARDTDACRNRWIGSCGDDGSTAQVLVTELSDLKFDIFVQHRFKKDDRVGLHTIRYTDLRRVDADSWNKLPPPR